MLNEAFATCPCGSGEYFNICCGKFISFAQYPITAEQLMRSRYSAYVLKDENYLLNSWHESTRPESLELKNDSTLWEKLKIISSSKDKINFVAYYTQDTLNKEKIYALTEQSHFVKEKTWLYLEGEEVKTAQLTNNMLCPCQSGRKFKRCCAINI